MCIGWYAVSTLHVNLNPGAFNLRKSRVCGYNYLDTKTNGIQVFVTKKNFSHFNMRVSGAPRFGG